MTRTTIRFTHGYNRYVKGDVATFDKHVAEVMIRKGFAVKVKDIPGPANHKAIARPDLTRGIGWADKARARGVQEARSRAEVAPPAPKTSPAPIAPQAPAQAATRSAKKPAKARKKGRK